MANHKPERKPSQAASARGQAASQRGPNGGRGRTAAAGGSGADEQAASASGELERLQALLAIDEEDLAREWHRQPQMYVEFVRYAARCQAALVEATLASRVTEAKLSLQIRKENPPGGRWTERAIEERIRVHESYIAAEKHRIMMLERAEIAAGLARAAEQRERALKWLSQRELGAGLSGSELADVADEVARVGVKRLIRKAAREENQ